MTGLLTVPEVHESHRLLTRSSIQRASDAELAVNAEKGVWRCHGCQRGGDLVGFVMHQRHLNAVEALRFLEEIVDVPGVAA
jgi:DNA primase